MAAQRISASRTTRGRGKKLRRRNGEGGVSGPDKLGRYRATLELPPVVPGKRNQKAFWGRTVAEVIDKLEEAKAEIRTTGSLIEKSTTVQSWYDRWVVNNALPTYKPSQYRAVTSIFRAWVLPRIGKKRIADVRPSDILSLYSAMYRAGRSTSTALKTHWVLSRFFEDARKEFRVPNVIRDVAPPKAAPSNRGAIPVQDAMKILAEAAFRDDGTRWWTALLCGMRQGERIGATRDSVNRETREFTVQWSLTEVTFEHGCEGTCAAKRGGSCPQRRPLLMPGLEHRQLSGRLFLVRPKSSKPRTFYLIDPLYERLIDYLDRTADDPNPHNLIWHRPDGAPWTPGRDQAEWRSVLHAAGVITAEQAKTPRDRRPGTPDTPTTHFARHTTVSVLMELGVPDAVVARIVGHIDERTTAHYQHPTAEMERDAMRQLGARFAHVLGAEIPSEPGSGR